MWTFPFEEMEFDEGEAAPARRPRPLDRPNLPSARPQPPPARSRQRAPGSQRPPRPHDPKDRRRPQRPTRWPFPVPTPWPTGALTAGTVACTCPCPVHGAGPAGDDPDRGFDAPAANDPIDGDAAAGAGELPFGPLQEIPFP